MNSTTSPFGRFYNSVRAGAVRGWHSFRMLALWLQVLIPVAIIAIIVAILVLTHKATPADAVQTRTVTVESVAELSGNGTGTSLVGSVQSISQADLLAQVGGVVQSVHTTLGATVPAGFVIADLDNASEAAAVLQASGAYDAAVASRDITSAQSGNTQTSFAEAQSSARATYRSGYTTIDSALRNQVDTFFGANTPTGPQLLISPGTSNNLSGQRRTLQDRMDAWRANVTASDSQDPITLLSQATVDTQAVSDFLVQLASAANDPASGATPAQKTALATARGIVDGELASLSAARDAYNAKKTGASIAGNGSTGTQLAASNAGVKAALGTLRAAQAQYEKTRIRATIGGTINSLSIKNGQYVSAFEHVASVAQNGALEIVANIPEANRDALTVGMKVTIEGGHTGIVTSIAPALNPQTKQIEVHIAVDNSPDLVNGQTVRITVPDQTTAESTTSHVASTTSSLPSSILIPLAAVKLLPDSRAVFTVDATGRLVAHPVTIGDVVGDQIQIMSGITNDLVIVTDARGLSEGQKVAVATSTTP